MASKGRETVELWRSPGKDRFGDEGEPRLVATFKKCAVIPRSSAETVDPRIGFFTIPGFQIYVPPQKTAWDLPQGWSATARQERVLPSDAVFVRGLSLAVEGRPEPYLDGKGKSHLFITTQGTARKQ